MMEGYLDDCVVISNGGVSNNNFYRMINQKNNAFNNWNFCCKSGNVIMSSTLTTMSYLFCRCWWLWSQTMLTYKLISFIQNFILFDFFRSATKCQSELLLCVGRGTHVMYKVTYRNIHSTCRASALEGWKFFFFFFFFDSNSFFLLLPFDSFFSLYVCYDTNNVHSFMHSACYKTFLDKASTKCASLPHCGAHIDSRDFLGNLLWFLNNLMVTIVERNFNFLSKSTTSKDEKRYSHLALFPVQVVCVLSQNVYCYSLPVRMT